jgi:aspartyl-tRNA(Asn)/glutamyl-tRNA(Gln) amidotransferase subunit A
MADLPASAPLGRIVAADDVLALCTEDIQQAHAAVVGALSPIGIEVVRRSAVPAIDAVDAHALTIMFAESARVHRARIDDPRVPSVLRRRLAKGLEVSDVTLNASIAALPNLVRDFEAQILRDADAILLPVMPINTPTAAECDPASDRFSPKTLYAMSRLTRWVNALGLPAVALPAGFDRDGLPVAMQIVGRPGSDLALLDLVRHVQAMTDWHGRVPTAIADLVPQPEPAP